MFRLERLFQWAGGALFVFSLLTLVAWYVFWLNHVRPYGGASAISFDLLLFSGFALHHSLLARPAAKNVMLRIVPERLLRSVYVWIASLLLLTVCALWRPVGGELYRAASAPAVVLSAVQIVGVWLIARAVAAIDALELAGIRRGSAEGLQTGGPYRFVRHPLYLGWMLAVFGAPHMTGDRLCFGLITAVYLLVAVRWEERSLEAHFGEAYERYRMRVRWRVVPGIY